MLGGIAEAEEGLRLGVEAPDRPGSAGVDGGGWGLGGLPGKELGREENGLPAPVSENLREVLDDPD